MFRKNFALSLTTAATALALSGCSFNASAYLTVPPEDIEKVASEALQEQINNGYVPILDCGDDRVKVRVDEAIDCVMTFDNDPTVLDAVVTITEVDGKDYKIFVKVADEPR
ncbi:DUF4333 domain-containing protein [Jonesia quinghaiensis]|uniref:DUF4333 domain-containing protein n=1 Tax=Jonesia quinghaiensis TaxID=262806 RepID=UPI000686F576|nr:DUF4333 domain-containing protein [Jonesia quinghaiensis]